jgi:hypothetical protein
MFAPSQLTWRIKAEEIAGCNCAWGCPCQFNALPTYGQCEGLFVWDIQDGYYGQMRLDGVRYAIISSSPGPVHEGNGTQQLIIDDRAAPEQRDALLALHSGQRGGAFFEIWASVFPHILAPAIARIAIERDRSRRQATVRVSGLIETQIEPIKNPVTAEELVAHVTLPHGFEYQEADMVNAAVLQATLGERILAYENRYAHFAAIDWSNE